MPESSPRLQIQEAANGRAVILLDSHKTFPPFRTFCLSAYPVARWSREAHHAAPAYAMYARSDGRQRDAGNPGIWISAALSREPRAVKYAGNPGQDEQQGQQADRHGLCVVG
jgi:hypothetical protein